VDETLLISADSHVVEPGDLWEERIDRAFRDRAPRRVRRPGTDNDVVVFDTGETMQYVGIANAGDTGRTQMLFEEIRPGAWDPVARLEEAASDGVRAEVLYPSIAMRLFQLEDAPLQAACMRAYNDWLAEYCAAAPDRLLGQAMIPTYDVAEGVREVARAAKLGLRGAMICGHPETGRDYGTRLYEDLWATIQDHALPVSLHVFTGPPKVDPRTFLADYAAAPALVQRSLALLIFSGVFDRFPGLRFVSAENDIGWIATFLARMDGGFERKGPRFPSDLRRGRVPSAVFKAHVSCTFMDDRPGLLTLEATGTDILMWGSDYPHDDSTWPESRAALDRQFRGVSEADRRKITRDNAAALYHLH
jgi:predicted TIM-barrel fold metal-dependent hydrolase